ncbi:hypothetical protein ACLKA6_001135 [Drosophila palustris]
MKTVDRPIQRAPPKRFVSEVYSQPELVIEPEIDTDDVDGDLAALALSCWNCGTNGHRYQDCEAERRVFCYGCGKADTYKPSCRKCSSKNGQARAQTSARKPVASIATNTE